MKQDYGELKIEELIVLLKERDSQIAKMEEQADDRENQIWELEEKIEAIERMLVISNKIISKTQFNEIDKLLDKI